MSRIFEEIGQAPDVFSYVVSSAKAGDLDGLVDALEKTISRDKKIFFVGAGTSYHACLFAKYVFAEENQVLVEEMIAGELESFLGEIERGDLVIFVSQSGETSDIIDILPKLKRRKVGTACLVNEHGSTLEKSCKHSINVMAGKECSIAATKTFFATICVLQILSDLIAHKRSILVFEKDHILSILQKVFSEENIKRVRQKANQLDGLSKVFVLGEGADLPLARELELKLKEMALLDAEAYSSDNFLHGPVILEDKKTAIVWLDSTLRESLDSRATERAGQLVSIPQDFYHQAEKKINFLITVLELQLFSLFCADGKEEEADKLLKKSI